MQQLLSKLEIFTKLNTKKKHQTTHRVKNSPHVEDMHLQGNSVLMFGTLSSDEKYYEFVSMVFHSEVCLPEQLEVTMLNY